MLAPKHVAPDPIGKGLKRGPQQPEERVENAVQFLALLWLQDLFFEVLEIGFGIVFTMEVVLRLVVRILPLCFARDKVYGFAMVAFNVRSATNCDAFHSVFSATSQRKFRKEPPCYGNLIREEEGRREESRNQEGREEERRGEKRREEQRRGEKRREEERRGEKRKEEERRGEVGGAERRGEREKQRLVGESLAQKFFCFQSLQLACLGERMYEMLCIAVQNPPLKMDGYQVCRTTCPEMLMHFLRFRFCIVFLFLQRFSLLATSNFEGSLARKLHFHDFTSLFLEEVSRKSFVSHS